MARVTVNELLVLIPNTTLDNDQLQLAIDSATGLIDKISFGCGNELTDNQLKNTELYLSAHFASTMDSTLKTLKSEKFEGSSTDYGFSGGEGYLSTDYGQTANLLSGGCVANLMKSPIGLFAVGF